MVAFIIGIVMALLAERGLEILAVVAGILAVAGIIHWLAKRK